VWTIIDNGDDELIISSGFWIVNRLGYLITKEECNEENEEYICQ
jgi:hypothetical protein